MRGKLIVIEGLDGCGKSTQLELLRKKLTAAEFISFPNYDSPSGEIIKRYLDGKYGEDKDVYGCYSASSFYAVDRYISYKTLWEKQYKNGKTIIAARYTSSNEIYQMAKLDKAHWDEFLSWLEDYEFVKLGLPRPDKTVFLDMPQEISQRLLSERYNGNEEKKDIHEKNLSFLADCRRAAMYAADRNGWTVLDCAKDGRPADIEDINKTLLDIIIKE